jgi:hypothetical protein
MTEQIGYPSKADAYGSAQLMQMAGTLAERAESVIKDGSARGSERVAAELALTIQAAAVYARTPPRSASRPKNSPPP